MTRRKTRAAEAAHYQALERAYWQGVEDADQRWTQRLRLVEQERAILDARYRALMKAVADGVALQVAPVAVAWPSPDSLLDPKHKALT